MNKRILACAFAVGALALAACNSNLNGIYGSATPTPTPSITPSPVPNPSASTAVVTVTYSASPLPNQPVELWSSNGNNQPAALILTQNTDSTGKTTFSNLTPAITYCFVSKYTPPGSLQEIKQPCTPYWGTSGVVLAF